MSVISPVPGATRRESPARRRIVRTAGRLFYSEGIRAVGIDRIIAEAGVAKATFYSHFPAKDDLVGVYLSGQSRRQRAAVQEARAGGMPPGEVLLSVFESIGDLGCGPGFRGCAFINAAAEYPDPAHPVRQVVAAHRSWFRELLRDLLTAAAHPDVERTSAMLMLFRDGLVVGGQLDDAEEVRDLVRDAVTRLLGPAPNTS
ncbi:TetR/AcrR family transcriptional regulator [Actinomadura alba]|uniref:TetR/AcrR family transcriptional regulator n=1 Tax=Actinomadura alba TaxID=406431 RepID=A0ABR7LKN8_9ACTN|nr:TetR/AcrR family transcriptional regulator [Actinomadura alba]MBC6465042.1 TetR/AcrR family transcriptional regulator [Actinomadura alba]